LALTYEATVEAQGFIKFVRTGLILEAGSTVRVDAKLEVGAVTQQVEVTTATPLLATDDAAVGGLDDAKKNEEISMLQSKPQHLMYYMEEHIPIMAGPRPEVSRTWSLRGLAFGNRAGSVRYPDGFRQAEIHQNHDLYPGQIELIPCQPMPRRRRMCVMVVVPALAGRNER
jgi:hypothetical protein